MARTQAGPNRAGVSRPVDDSPAARGRTWRQAMNLARNEITENGIAGYA
jgi:hypothetical protein